MKYRMIYFLAVNEITNKVGEHQCCLPGNKQRLTLLFTINVKHMGTLVKEFNDYRTKMNEVILSKENLVIKRLWNLDTNTYAEGSLDVKTKEMLGLVASMVLRCDDCIKYHLGKSHELGISTEQVYEVFAVANIVGGTIVIPHTRRAAEYWEELVENTQ
jgi:AhpD family alkylhydroperoxidase